MPDLTFEYHQQCTGHNQTWHIGGYDQTFDLRTGAHCTCKGFQFRKTCKHVQELQTTKLCLWSSAFSDEPQEQTGICPVCGSQTEAVRVAV